MPPPRAGWLLPVGRALAARLTILPRRIVRSGAGRVWILNAAMGAAGAGLFMAFGDGLRSPGHGVALRWWTVAALFFVTEMCVVHFEFKRQAHTFSLGEAALVLGLFFVDPPLLLAARIAGAGGALLLYRRQGWLKLVFNLANLCLEVVIAALLWHSLIGLGDPRGPAGWVAAIIATVAASSCSVALVAAAISLMEGTLDLETIPRTLPLSLVVSAASVSLGLIGATLLYHEPLALWLVVVPGALSFTAYGGYASVRRQRDLLELLHDATSVTHSSHGTHSVAEALLCRARRMFGVERAELTLFSGGDAAVRATVGASGRLEHDTVGGDTLDRGWTREAMSGRSTLVARPARGRFSTPGSGLDAVRDAMVSPVYRGRDVAGTLLVANRLSDVSTFGEDELQLLETLANHIGVSLDNDRLVGELKRSLARMTELNQLKDDFVASVSHELRTPLTSIRGYIDLLLRAGHRLPERERRAMLESVDRQGEQLWSLIEDLLVASGVESPPGRVTSDGVCIHAVVGDVVGAVAAAGHGNRLRVDLPSELPRVRGDAGRIGRILSKLVDNAVKHSRARGPIKVVGRLQGEVVLVAVEDVGPGIPPGEHERIFERFYQVDQSSTRPVGGAGLGLYICRRLAEGLGGRVWLERSDDKGSRFALALAAAAPEREGDQAAGRAGPDRETSPGRAGPDREPSGGFTY
jgi:signal transduction histidine kinase